MDIKVFDNIAEVRDLWIEFQAGSDGYGFNRYEWIETWCDTIGQALGIKPCILVAGDRMGEPVMILPFGIQRCHGISVLTFLDGGVSDYNSPLVCSGYPEYLDDRGFSDLWRRFRRVLPSTDVIHLKKMPATIGKQKNPILDLPCRPFREKGHHVVLKGKWDDFYQTRVKKRIRNDSRRQRKRLAEIGDVRFVIAVNGRQAAEITETMIQHKRRRFLETGMPDLFREKEYRRFYGKAAEMLAEKGMIHVSALLVDNTVVATHWGMVSDGRFYYLMPTYEGGKWRKYSTGRLLLEHLLEWCFTEGIGVFDFTVGGEIYKKDWCDHEMILYEYLKTNSLKGYSYCFSEWAKNYVIQRPKLLKKAASVRASVLGYMDQKEGKI